MCMSDFESPYFLAPNPATRSIPLYLKIKNRTRRISWYLGCRRSFVCLLRLTPTPAKTRGCVNDTHLTHALLELIHFATTPSAIVQKSKNLVPDRQLWGFLWNYNSNCSLYYLRICSTLKAGGMSVDLYKLNHGNLSRPPNAKNTKAIPANTSMLRTHDKMSNPNFFLKAMILRH